MDGKTLAAMELFDQLGGHTVLRFADLKANVAVPPDTFHFTPPKGADVIGEDKPARK
jgi:outer membrane lipoprotein carrier protein